MERNRLDQESESLKCKRAFQRASKKRIDHNEQNSRKINVIFFNDKNGRQETKIKLWGSSQTDGINIYITVRSKRYCQSKSWC